MIVGILRQSSVIWITRLGFGEKCVQMLPYAYVEMMYLCLVPLFLSLSLSISPPPSLSVSLSLCLSLSLSLSLSPSLSLSLSLSLSIYLSLPLSLSLSLSLSVSLRTSILVLCSCEMYRNSPSCRCCSDDIIAFVLTEANDFSRSTKAARTHVHACRQT